MIEAIAAAALLVIVALGVLKGLDTAQRSSGREKARSVAAALTEQDQERLRSFRAVDLANYDETREIEIEINKVKYTITSQVDWVRDSTGGTESCNNSATQADYMRITSIDRVAADQHADPAGQDVEPRRAARSARSAPTRARSASRSTTRAGEGVEGMPVTITGPSDASPTPRTPRAARSSPTSRSAATRRSVNSRRLGRQGRQPERPPSAPPSARAPSTSRRSSYDQAASVDVEFDTETLGSATVPRRRRPQLSAANAGVPAGPFSPVRRRCASTSPPAAPRASITATGLFPFTDGYGLYGGGCPGADPTRQRPATTTRSYPGAFVDVEPGEASPPVTVRLPSINLRVLHNGSPLDAAAATATTRIVVTRRAPNCSEKFTFTAPATDAQRLACSSSALPFGNYDRLRRVDHAGARRPTAACATITSVRNWYHRGIKPPDVASPVDRPHRQPAARTGPAT